jgi:hypothetical protein
MLWSVGRWLRRRRSGVRLRLAQSLGAFRLPSERDISPLYVFFDVENSGRDTVEISHVYVAPKRTPGFLYEGPFETDNTIPGTLRPGETARFWVRAKTLARALKAAGYGGRPRLALVAEDDSGEVHRTTFEFRTDEYLALKDE